MINLFKKMKSSSFNNKFKTTKCFWIFKKNIRNYFFGRPYKPQTQSFLESSHKGINIYLNKQLFEFQYNNNKENMLRFKCFINV